MSDIVDYRRAATIQEACQLLEQPVAYVIAGGTDILLRSSRMSGEISLVDIGHIQELAGIREQESGIRIGAMTHLADVARAEIFQQPAYQALVMGAIQVGSPQIRNLASIGGNLCNAAPSADTAAPLLALNACAEITSRSEVRTVPLTEFFLGPGKTVLTRGELLTSILIPTASKGAKSFYIKHSPRRAMDLAFVGAAVALTCAGEPQAAIALSAVAPTPIRVPEAELSIRQSRTVTKDVLVQASYLTAEAARPISDIRSTDAYRKEMVQVLTLRALCQVFDL